MFRPVFFQRASFFFNSQIEECEGRGGIWSSGRLLEGREAMVRWGCFSVGEKFREKITK
jgi:hypothetical protein